MTKENIYVNYIPTVDDVEYDRYYHFSDISMFKVCSENRPSTEKDAIVKSYAKKMVEGKWRFDLSPIYVGITSLEVLNGEHRRKAIKLAREKGTEINDILVVFVDDSTSEKKKQAIEALNGGKHWNSDDYIKTLIEMGDPNFIFLDKFCRDEDHPQLHKNKPYYNKGGVLICGSYNKFKKGYFEGEWSLSKSDIDKAEKRYLEVVRIKKSLRYDDVGQDCWQQICEAWYRIDNDKILTNKIKALNDGIESFYKELANCENTNSNKPEVWYQRFVHCIESAYQKREIR